MVVSLDSLVKYHLSSLSFPLLLSSPSQITSQHVLLHKSILQYTEVFTHICTYTFFSPYTNVWGEYYFKNLSEPSSK